MIIKDLETENDIEAEIERITQADLRSIKKAKSFGFNWSEYAGAEQEVYKLIIKETGEILGLMCVIDRPEPGFNFLQIEAIEARLDQQGSGKRYGRIAGCLLAYAARLAIKKGHDGYILLVAKTEKAGLFHGKYGFDYIGDIGTLAPRMVSVRLNSLSLIRKYLDTT